MIAPDSVAMGNKRVPKIGNNIEELNVSWNNDIKASTCAKMVKLLDMLLLISLPIVHSSTLY